MLIVQNQQIHKLSKIRQSKPCNNSRLRFWICSCIDSKVVYFKWTVLVFVSEIVLNLFFLFARNSFIKFCPTSLTKYYKKFQELLTSRNFIGKPHRKSLICPKVSFFLKKLFLDFRELRSGRVGKQADIHILLFFCTL